MRVVRVGADHRWIVECERPLLIRYALPSLRRAFGSCDDRVVRVVLPEKHFPLPEEVAAIISRSFLAGVPREEAFDVLRGGYRIECAPATSIARAGSGSLALVLDGLLRAYLDSGAARQVTVRYARPGDVIGLVHLFGARTDVQLQAVSQVSAWVVPGRRLEELAARSAPLAMAVAKECAARAADAMDELGLVSFGAVRARLARHLLDLATSRQRTDELVAEVTQQQLADACGSVREVITRALQGLKEERCIKGTEGGITICDAAALDAIATQRSRTRA